MERSIKHSYKLYLKNLVLFLYCNSLIILYPYITRFLNGKNFSTHSPPPEAHNHDTLINKVQRYTSILENIMAAKRQPLV